MVKIVNRHISVKNCPILMKFGTLHQILNPVTVTWPKIEIFGIQDGGDRHLENRFFGHNSLTCCPISAKICLRKQNSMPTKATWQKLQIFKIQDGGRLPFWKSLYRHISVNKKLSCRSEAARCFVFVCSQLQHTAQFFISSYYGFRFTSA